MVFQYLNTAFKMAQILKADSKTMGSTPKHSPLYVVLKSKQDRSAVELSFTITQSAPCLGN